MPPSGIDPAEQVAHGLCENIIDAVNADLAFIGDVSEGISLEQAIGKLADEDIGSLFQKLADQFTIQFKAAGDDARERANVKHRYRRLLGPRYSCLLLTSVA